MIPLAKAYSILDGEAAKFSPMIESIETNQSLGRVLACNQYAKLTLPPFNKSTMDGYAILANDEREEYRLINAITAAGVAPETKLIPGTAAKVMTGAPVPEKSGKVIPIEFTLEQNDTLKIISPSNAINICRKGEYVKEGDLILKKGTQIGAIELANLICCGIKTIDVFVLPKIAIISIENEMVDDAENIDSAKIINTNAPMLQALCSKYNLQVVTNLHAKDNCGKTIELLNEAITKADIVLLSGNVSACDFDFIKNTIDAAKLNIHFDKIALKQGSPMTFATTANKLFFGLPGNAVSAYLTFQLFVLRALGVVYGRSLTNHILLPLARNFTRKNAAQTEYVPCQLLDEGKVAPIEMRGAGDLSALLLCDGFFVINQGVAKIEEKKMVKFLAK